MRIALVGAGNVATCIGPRLKEVGHNIVSVYSRTTESAKVLAERLEVPYTTYLRNIPEADVFLVMLRDEALMERAAEIASCAGKAILLHTAGSVTMDVWRTAGTAMFGVLYPMQTFSRTSVVDWDSVPLFIEGSSDQVTETVRELALTISPNVTRLSSEGRRKLHVAAVFTCNFSNHMYAIAERLLAEEGVPFSVMLPLVRETARKVETLSPLEAQTGPAVRGDSKVVEGHISLLRDYPELAKMYRMISIDINKELE